MPCRRRHRRRTLVQSSAAICARRAAGSSTRHQSRRRLRDRRRRSTASDAVGLPGTPAQAPRGASSSSRSDVVARSPCSGVAFAAATQRAPHHQRILARRGRRRRVVVVPARDRLESPRPRTARSPPRSNCAPRGSIARRPRARATSMNRRSSMRPRPGATTVGNHRQVEDLRFARRQHQHAERDDPVLALADASRSSPPRAHRGNCRATTARRGSAPRARRRRRSPRWRSGRHTTPGANGRAGPASPSLIRDARPPPARRAVSATRWRTYNGSASCAATPSPAARARRREFGDRRAPSAAASRRRARGRAVRRGRETRRIRRQRRCHRPAGIVTSSGFCTAGGRDFAPRVAVAFVGGDIHFAHARIETRDRCASRRKRARPPAPAPPAFRPATTREVDARARAPARRRRRSARR